MWRSALPVFKASIWEDTEDINSISFTKFLSSLFSLKAPFIFKVFLPFLVPDGWGWGEVESILFH